MTRLENAAVVHNGVACTVEFARYNNNNRTAIRLTVRDSGEPYATATSNVPEAELADDEVLVKNYAECRGMLDSLVAAGLVAPTGRTVETGYVELPVAKLLRRPDQY